MAGDRTPPLGRRPPEGSSWPYVVFIDRLPRQADTARMRVWRQLRRLEALALQQGVYVLPRTPATAAALTRMARHVADAGGITHRLPLGSLPPDEDATIVAGCRIQRPQQDRSAAGPSSISDTAQRAADGSAPGAPPWAAVAPTAGDAAQRGGDVGRTDACDEVSVGAEP